MEKKLSVIIRLWMLLALLTLGIANSASAEEVLYCTDNKITGFAPKAQYELRRYEQRRFTIKVDFQTNEIYSEQLYLGAIHGRRCVSYVGQNNVFYCYNDTGTVFALNKETLKYHFANVFLADEKTTDDIFLTHGQCEKF